MALRVKRYRIKIQQEAIDDLDEIYRFILRDSPARAKSFIKQLQNKILSLKSFPQRGSRIKLLENPESEEEIRLIEHQGYLIFYTIIKKEVIVLHMTGPGQDWSAFFL